MQRTLYKNLNYKVIILCILISTLFLMFIKIYNVEIKDEISPVLLEEVKTPIALDNNIGIDPSLESEDYDINESLLLNILVGLSAVLIIGTSLYLGYNYFYGAAAVTSIAAQDIIQNQPIGTLSVGSENIIAESISEPNLITSCNTNSYNITKTYSSPNLTSMIKETMDNNVVSESRKILTKTSSLPNLKDLIPKVDITRNSSAPNLNSVEENIVNSLISEAKNLIKRCTSVPEITMNNLDTDIKMSRSKSLNSLIPSGETIASTITANVPAADVNATVDNIPIIEIPPQATSVGSKIKNTLSSFASIASRGMGIYPSLTSMTRGAIQAGAEAEASSMNEQPIGPLLARPIVRCPEYSDIVVYGMNYPVGPIIPEEQDKQIKYYLGITEGNDPRIGAIPKEARHYFDKDFDDIDALDLNSRVGLPIYHETATNKFYSYIGFRPAAANSCVDTSLLNAYDVLKREAPDKLLPVEFHRLRNIDVCLHLNTKNGVYYVDIRELNSKGLLLSDGLKPKDLRVYQDPDKTDFYNNEVAKSYFNFKNNSNLNVD